jgi:preprotein translocase subunit YajC
MGSPVFLIWIVLIGAMFYFMMIRPQKRARQQQVDLLQHLQPGAQVRTTAQIMGTVVEVGDDWAVVETTPGTRIKFGKPAIVGIILPEDAEADADAETGADTDADTGAELVADAPTPGGIGDAPAADADRTETFEAAETPAVQDAVPAKDAETDAEAEADTDAKAEPVAKP